MKVVSFLVIAFAASVAGAPTIFTSIPEYLQETNRHILRDKRSKIGHGFYSYGGLSSPVGYYSPYQSYQSYVNPYAYGYQSLFPGCGRGYYRTDDHHNDQETMNFSDKGQEHPPSSRGALDGAATTSNFQITQQSASSLPNFGQLVSPTNGPAYGVFSNVRNTDCNVPLLFSCAPSIVPGRFIKAPAMGYDFGAYGYRGAEDLPHDPHASFHDEHPAHDSVGTGAAPSEPDNVLVVGHQ